MSNILIECRQKSARTVNSNGDYEIVLDTPLPVDSLDQLVVHNCFLDTTIIDPTKIEIDEDTTIKMTTVLYQRFWYIGNGKYFSGLLLDFNQNDFAIYS